LTVIAMMRDLSVLWLSGILNSKIFEKVSVLLAEKKRVFEAVNVSCIGRKVPQGRKILYNISGVAKTVFQNVWILQW
jgi:hypothetical protein